ncbi:MAG: hypothetical protein ACK2T7_13440, partial [Anaerolineales bacterium]
EAQDARNKRAELEDSLEDRSIREGRPADEAMAFEVLQAHGAPIKLAQAYRRGDNLIRPETYRMFKPVAVLVSGVLLLQLLLTVGLNIGSAGVDWTELILSWVEDLFAAFGILVFSFAMIERTTPAGWPNWPIEQISRQWDATALKKGLYKKAVRAGEYWFEVAWLVLLIVWFGIFPQWVGVGSNLNGEWSFLPVLAESFSLYQPWVIGYFLARLVFCVAIAQQAYWDTRMRAVQIAVKLFGLVILYAMLTGPAVIGLNPEYLALHNIPQRLQQWVESGGMVSTIFYLVLGINLAVHAVQLGVQLLRLFRDRSSLDAVKVYRVKKP